MSYGRAIMGIRSITDNGPALGVDDIRALEARLGTPLPTPYRDFLLQNNGGIPSPRYFGQWMLDRFYTVIAEPESSKDLWYMIALRREDLPDGVIPVAGEESGDDICLALTGENRGKVYKWSLEGRAPAMDLQAMFPNGTWDEYEFKPDDWPEYPDLTLIAEDFAEFLGSFQEDPDEAASEN